jgi:hypothetical protein
MAEGVRADVLCGVGIVVCVRELEVREEEGDAGQDLYHGIQNLMIHDSQYQNLYFYFVFESSQMAV